MSNKNIRLFSNNAADFDCLKLKLGSMRGIISMDIDNKTNDVSVSFDDHFVHENQIIRVLNDIGYQPSKS